MFILIPSLLIVAGVALAARVVYKKIPQDLIVWNETVAKEDFGPTFYERALTSASLKFKKTALSLSTKLVYRLKITSLKTDNFFTGLLKEIKVHKSNMEAEAPLEVATEQSKKEISPVKAPFFKVELTSVEDNSIKKEEPTAESRTSFASQEQQLMNQLAYNPKDVSAYKRLGWLYLENNKPMEARQAFKMSVKLGSKDKVIISKLLEMGGVVHKEGSVVRGVEITSQSGWVSDLVKSNILKSKEKEAKVKRIKVKKV